MGTNWFMPALVKRRFGASGKSEEEGTMVCCFSRKKSRNDCLICADVIPLTPMNTNSSKAKTATLRLASVPLRRQDAAGPHGQDGRATRLVFFFVEAGFDLRLNFFV